MHRWHMFSQFFRDVRYGVRVLVRDRGFSAVAVLTLALGLGANTAIFTVLYNLVLRPLPYERPDRLVRVDILMTTDARGARSVGFSASDFRNLASASRSFESLAAYRLTSFTLRDRAGADRLMGEVVSAGYFPLLGIVPVAGRTFHAEEDRTPGTHPVAIISSALWRSRFGARRDVIGDVIRLNGVALMIVGIAPEGFKGHSRRADVWIPSMMEPAMIRGSQAWFEGIGRLRDGVTTAQADAEVRSLVAGMPNLMRRGPKIDGVAVALEESERDPQLRTLLRLLYGAVSFVVLIACANVANLLLARGVARRREIAIRLSLGADRAAVARQLLTESLLLSLAGAGLGFSLAVWTLDGLAALRPAADTNVWPTYARALDLDSFVASAPVGLFTLGLALLTTALCGLLPAWRTCRLDVQATLRVDTAAWGPRREGRPWRIVIAAQVALVLVLLTSAGLTIRSLARLVDRPIGIDPRGLLTFRVDLPAETYDRAAATAFFDRLRARIGSLPDVQGVARIRHVPIIERGTVTEVRIDSSADRHYVGYNAVDPEFFRLFRVPLLAGRFFEARDAALQPVAIVTESAARQMFGKATPLGRRITAMGTTAEIVGVIADVRYEPQRPQLPIAGDVYVDFEQQRGASRAYMAIRTGGDPRHQLPALRRAVAELDPEVPLYDAVTMADRLQSVRSYARFTTFVLLASAVLALSLAIVGIYGTLGYAVASRRREVGIRMALGARRSHVVGLFLRDGLKTCAIGMAVGLPLAIASARAMRILLYEIAPGDPLTFAVAVVLLVSAATLACLLPSHRAAAVDPNLVLRE